MSNKLLGKLFRTVFIGLLVFTLLPVTGLLAGSAITGSGKIHTIDPLMGKVGVKLSDGSTIFLRVPVGARVMRNGSGAELGDLVLRDKVTFTYDSVTRSAVILTASGPRASRGSGQVKGVLLASGVVRIGSQSYTANANTKITRNGHVVSLGHLTQMDEVSVHSRPGMARRPRALDIIGHGPEEGEVEGTVTAVNTTAGSIKIKPENKTAEVTLTVDAKTMIEVNDKLATIADILVGMKVDAEYNPTTLLAYRIDAESEGDEAEVKGTVTAVDTTLNTITITPSEGGPPITLTVKAATEIEVNDASATLKEVKVGMPVRAEYDRLTLIATKIEAGDQHRNDDENAESVEGDVTAVSASTVTITPTEEEDHERSGSGAPITLTIDASTEIRIDDGVGTIADIKVGIRVQAEYDRVTMIANKIEIETDEQDEEDTESVVGEVTAVSANTVTIAPKGDEDHERSGSGAPVTLTIDASTKITSDHHVGTIADIKVGIRVQAEYDRATMIAKRIEIGTGDDD